MAANTLNVTSVYDQHSIRLYGDVDVAFNNVVTDSFRVGFFTVSDEVFNFTTNRQFVDWNGKTVNSFKFGGKPGMNIELMFDPVGQKWYVCLVVGQQPLSILITQYPWEGEEEVSDIVLLSSTMNVTSGLPIKLTTEIKSRYEIEKVEFFKNGSLFYTDMTAAYSATDSFTYATNGAYTYSAKLYDINGSVFDSPPINVTVNLPAPPPVIDNVLPTVTLTASQTNITEEKSIILTAVATDNIGVSKVLIYRDSVLMQTLTTAPFATTVDLKRTDNGSIEFKAIAYDSSDNLSSESMVTVTVSISNLPPPAEYPFSIDNATVSEYNAAISAAALGSKRNAGAQAIINAMKPDYRLYIYQETALIIPVEYTGSLSVITTANDVGVTVGIPDSSEAIANADLSHGTWHFELQGGAEYTRVIKGSVGPVGSNKLLILEDNPDAGSGTDFTFVLNMPREIDVAPAT